MASGAVISPPKTAPIKAHGGIAEELKATFENISSPGGSESFCARKPNPPPANKTAQSPKCSHMLIRFGSNAFILPPN
jgi:hypothetical protein